MRQPCVNGNWPCLSVGNFDPLQNQHPLTDC